MTSREEILYLKKRIEVVLYDIFSSLLVQEEFESAESRFWALLPEFIEINPDQSYSE